MSDPGAVVNHVGQCVTDLERSRRFYVEALGFAVERELTVPDRAAAPLLGIDAPGLTACYLRLGDFVLELLLFDRDGNPAARTRAFNEPGLTHLSISVADLEATVAAVVAHGGEVVTALSMAAVVRDPDGQVVELLPMAYRDQLDAAGRAT